MKHEDLLIPLVGTLWACATLVFSVTLEANKIRDRVLRGKDETGALDLEFRKHLKNNDWLPYSVFVGLGCLGFGTFAAMTPYLLDCVEAQKAAKPITYMVAISAVAMGFAWTPSAIKDWRAMNKALTIES